LNLDLKPGLPVFALIKSVAVSLGASTRIGTPDFLTSCL